MCVNEKYNKNNIALQGKFPPNLENSFLLQTETQPK